MTSPARTFLDYPNHFDLTESIKKLKLIAPVVLGRR
jgi:hypothetical protein